MTESIIDRLVVTLGLDPKDFSKKITDATKAQDKHAASVKGIDKAEKGLNETQKSVIKSLRESAINTERARKEMSAASKVGAEFWGVLEKGALSFGAAFATAGFVQMTRDAVSSNSAIQRLSATLGMGARDADAWGKAIEQKVGGNAGEALSTIRNLNRQLQMPGAMQGAPQDLIMAMARVKALTGIGVDLWQGPNRKPRSVTDIVHDLSPAVRAMGQEQADAVLGGQFDEGTLRFMGLSDKDQAGALAEARKNTPGGPDPYGDAEKLRQETADLTQAFGALKDTALLLGAPALTAGIKNLVAWLQYLRDPTAPNAAANRDAAIRSNDEALMGKAWLAKKDAERIVDGMNGTGVLGISVYHGQHWTRDQRVARAQQLLAQGEDAHSIPGIIAGEEAAGRAPGAQTAVVPLRGGAPAGSALDTMLDGIRDLGERSGSNSVSPKGARGRYQFMPGTASQYGLTDPTNDAQSRAAAGRYLSDLYAKYGDWSKATAAYNWGPSNLDHDIAGHGNSWRDFLPRETSSYLSRMAPALASAGGDGGGNVQVTVNGPTTINTKATDGEGIRKSWAGHWALVAQAQTGPH